MGGAAPVPSTLGDGGTGGSSRDDDRRTTVRGGRTFHDDGSCGGFAPLAGTGGCPAPPRPAEVGEPPGLHAVCPVRPDVDLRTAAPGGSPTVGAPGVPTPARPVGGALG